MRQLLAGEWARTAAAALALALLAAALAVMVPGPVKGDLLVGLYFASLSLLLWLRSVWIVRARAVRSSGLGHLIALALGLGIGGTLIAADIITAGRL